MNRLIPIFSTDKEETRRLYRLAYEYLLSNTNNKEQSNNKNMYKQVNSAKRQLR